MVGVKILLSCLINLFVITLSRKSNGLEAYRVNLTKGGLHSLQFDVPIITPSTKSSRAYLVVPKFTIGYLLTFAHHSSVISP